MKVKNEESLFVSLTTSEVEQILREHVERKLRAGKVELESYDFEDCGFSYSKDEWGCSRADRWSISWAAALSNYQAGEEE